MLNIYDTILNSVIKIFEHNSRLRNFTGRTIRFLRFFFQYKMKGITVLNGQAGNDRIRDLLNNNTPFLVGRIGATEQIVINEWHKSKSFSKNACTKIQKESGVFPSSHDILVKFVKIYEESLSFCELLGVWGNPGESQTIKRNCHNTELTKLRSLESYYWTQPWTELLREKKVLVIHPFADTIKKQFSHRKNLFRNHTNEILPDFQLLTYKAVQALDPTTLPFKNWLEALDHMKVEISCLDFDIALVGAGAFGLPLAAYIKTKLNKSAIVTAGATQLYFGIIGNRWNRHEVSKFFNEYWVRPSLGEIPKTAKDVEGACYW